MKFTSFLMAAAVCFSTTAHAYVIVPDKDVIEQLLPAPQHTLVNDEISVLVWNVLKGERKQNFATDLRSLSAGKEIAILQEGMADSYMPSVLTTISSLGWVIGKSFYTTGQQDPTGVITGAGQDSQSSVFLRTVDVEPFVNTPKVTLFTTYQLQNGERLLVVNIHAINFVGMGPYERQLNSIRDILVGWKQKVIFAGDFNTWSTGRFEVMRQVAREAGLTEITFNRDARKMVLDHVFVRGCTQKSSQVHNAIQSSDHKPLTVELSCI